MSTVCNNITNYFVEFQIQHLLERFKDGEAQLLEPIVPGALIYKEQMKERARVRANIRRRDTGNINAMLREVKCCVKIRMIILLLFP